MINSFDFTAPRDTGHHPEGWVCWKRGPWMAITAFIDALRDSYYRQAIVEYNAKWPPWPSDCRLSKVKDDGQRFVCLSTHEFWQSGIDVHPSTAWRMLWRIREFRSKPQSSGWAYSRWRVDYPSLRTDHYYVKRENKRWSVSQNGAL